jgi:hypothetical protein
MKKIPYGISNFSEIIKEDYYFVDKSMYIPKIEEAARFLFFMRPRRFGKSVFVDMLEAYYDIFTKDKFKDLFGSLWIGKNPTPDANRYQVLRLDFSLATASLDKLDDTFNEYCNGCIDAFIKKYKDFYSSFTVESVLETKRAGQKINLIGAAAKAVGNPLYLIIDEYDNFTNVVLSSHGQEVFHRLTHAEGFYRDFFKTLKPAFSRIFMMGVSPVTMDDLTSGYNIAFNISQLAPFNSMLGFSEEELRRMLEYYKEQGALAMDVDEVLDVMRPWYNNYCFSRDCCGEESVYNTTMSLYFLNNLITYGSMPEQMVDSNTRTDYKKLRQLVDIDRGIGGNRRQSIILDIANKEYSDIKLITTFPALAVTDENNFQSLIYYYGMLTMGAPRGMRVRMIIPNQCVRLQYWDYIVGLYQKEHSLNLTRLTNLFDSLAFDGDWEPLMRYLGAEYKKASSVRDAIGGEHNVQGFIKAYLAMCDYHLLCPEIEMGYGYSDFLMIPQLNRFPEARHSYILELKYAKPSSPESEVERLSHEADKQLVRYLSDRKLIPLLQDTTVHPIKLVFHGTSLAVCRQCAL